MKKIFIFAAAAAMFASCAQDELITEVEPSNVEQAIGFETFTNLATRGAENSTANDKNDLSIYHNSFYVWGYKTVASVYTPVFIGSEDAKGQATVKFESDWTYAPLRYWDKAANHYDFYAAAPATKAWTATKNTTLDSDDDLKFALASFTTDGKSLAQSAENPTEHLNSVFATDNTNNPDLMIANDITDYKIYTSTDKVNFEFNHILSRLNIALKTGITKTYDKKDKEVTISDIPYTVYVYDNGTDEYVLSEGQYFPLQGTASEPAMGTTAFNTGISGYDVSKWAAVRVNDETKPISGIVKLTELAVVNLKTTGAFDEKGFTDGAANGFDALIDKDVLNAGTDKRWNATDLTADATIGVKFNNTDNISSFNATKNAVTGTGPYISGSSEATNVLTDKYNYVYQGLLIPQTIDYAPCELDGSDVTATTDGTSTPYLKITYTIDGDSKTAYYNLAQVMSNVEADYVENGRKAYAVGTTHLFSVDGTAFYENATTETASTQTFAFTDGTKLYSDFACASEIFYNESDGIYYENHDATTDEYTVALSPQPTAVINVNPLKRKDFASDGECDYTFCEGWQHNLKININPATIYFSAEVFKWATWTPEYDFTIE